MMTFNEKRHWVFPLVPTACAYTKLNEYFGKLRSPEIEAPQLQGDFGGILAVQKVIRAQSGDCKVKWKVSIRRFLKWDMVRNTLFRMVNTISGCSVAEMAG